MCRNIKPLFNYKPPVTDEEIRDAALQYMRIVSGFNKLPKANKVVGDFGDYRTSLNPLSSISMTRGMK